jgi:tRNA pseudouridine38-40 synthase
MTWKLTLEYDGGRYRGWHEQTNARTVMGELRRAAEQFFGTEVDLMGAGRTDAGVHAAGQVAHLRARTRRVPKPEAILRALNEDLPADIAVLEVEAAPPEFHARHDALSRTYVYQFATRKTAFSKRYVWWIKECLNGERMREAARLFAGRHDFSCFRAEDPSKPGDSPVVVVLRSEIEEQEDLILFHIEASHFLWRMVRRLAGVLAKVGQGELEIRDVERLLEGSPVEGMDVAAWTAPGSGLFLESVRYR